MKDEPEDGEADAIIGGVQAKVALKELRGKLTTVQLAAEHGIHQTMVSA